MWKRISLSLLKLWIINLRQKYIKIFIQVFVLNIKYITIFFLMFFVLWINNRKKFDPQKRAYLHILLPFYLYFFIK